MEHESDRFLTGALTSLSKGRQKIFSHIGLWISALSLLVAVVITFTDVSVLALSAESLTLKMAVYAAVTMIMFLALEEEGERTGRTETAYKECEKTFLSVKAAVTPAHYDRLEDFCEHYIEEDLAKRRSLLLLTYGFTEKRDSLPPRLERRLRALKPLRISAASILDPSTHPIRSPLSNPEKRRKCRLAARLLPSLLCSVFGIGIAIGVRGTLTPSAVLEGLFKICALLIVSLRGYAIGYLFVGESEIPFLRAKTRLLSQFLCVQNLPTDPPTLDIP